MEGSPRRRLRLNRSHGGIYPETPFSAVGCRDEETPELPTALEEHAEVAAAKKLWEEWIQHTDIEYHAFDEETATKIRSALLDWYRSSRRKLPWRGDPPPYDGSTAGINSGNMSNKKKPQKMSSSSTKITQFFAPTASKKRKTTKATETTTRVKTEPSDQQAVLSADTATIPVSGYGVWVSEIMLQQTRVEAVIPYWCRWMNSFPTVHDLASATEDEVNAHWAGLGFYRRARLLHQGAQYVVQNYARNAPSDNETSKADDGQKGRPEVQLPSSVEELLTIPGIGPYTAAAISSIAFDQTVPVVDGNVCRVLSRLTGIANHIKAPALKDKHGWELARAIVEADGGRNAGEVNQALMELGATYCAPSGTGLDPRDPLREFYLSTRLGRAYHILQRNGQSPVGWSSSGSSSMCALCDANGISDVLDLFANEFAAAETLMSMDEAKKLGHAIFPLDPPKNKKREEDLAMAAISTRIPAENSDQSIKVGVGEVEETWWLLVKRPPKGLLAGQWEFPSLCVQVRSDNDSKIRSKKKKSSKSSHENVESSTSRGPPSAKMRSQALTKFLMQLTEAIPPSAAAKDGVDAEMATANDSLAIVQRTALKEGPLEHIFSHIKHYMWVEAAELSIPMDILEWKATLSKNVDKGSPKDVRQVRWMRECDMDQVGITAGVKKVLRAVKAHQERGRGLGGTKNKPASSRPKRRRQ